MNSDPFARRLASGKAGLRVGIKECVDISGVVTRMGSRAFHGAAPATRNADVVDALVAGGFQIIGTLKMHELAFGMSGISAAYGTPLNPQDPALIPGGSSSGSAVAVGRGLVDIAIGTDTGGSIRLPAACCGVYGFKPSFARVSRKGIHPAVSSLDCVGPIAASMAGIIHAMGALDPHFEVSQPPSNIRVGLVRCEATQHLQQAMDDALALSGWSVEPVELPGLEQAHEAALSIISAEVWSAYGELTDKGLLGADVEARLSAARHVDRAQVEKAEQVREAFIVEVDSALARVDALVLPTLPRLPPTLAEVQAGASIVDLSRLVRPFNLSGHPALTIPVEIPGSALKAGLQLVGERDADATLCALGLDLSGSLRDTANCSSK